MITDPCMNLFLICGTMMDTRGLHIETRTSSEGSYQPVLSMIK